MSIVKLLYVYPKRLFATDFHILPHEKFLTCVQLQESMTKSTHSLSKFRFLCAFPRLLCSFLITINVYTFDTGR